MRAFARYYKVCITAHVLVCYSVPYRDFYNAGQRKEEQAADFLIKRRRKLQQRRWGLERYMQTLLDQTRLCFYRRRKEQAGNPA
jgi:hypothetical protein